MANWYYTIGVIKPQIETIIHKGTKKTKPAKQSPKDNNPTITLTSKPQENY